MPKKLIYEIRREAQERGLDWSGVQAAYWEIKALEWEKRQRPNEIRETAWIMATASSPGCWPFWRHGFVARWGARVAQHDYTVVPGYDEIAQQIATEFPEYATHDGTQRLFDFLLSPYNRMPERVKLYRKAMDVVEYERTVNPTNSSLNSFEPEF